MINLLYPTDTLEFKLAGAVATTELPWTAHWVDIFTASQAVANVGMTNGTSSGTTVVVMVPGPAAGHTRTVKYVTIRNSDSTGATPTVQIGSSGSKRIMLNPPLSVGDLLEYND
jgi:hypothetical protein